MADKPRAKVVFKRRPPEPVVGPKGERGEQGIPGERGEQGTVGKLGPIGPKGDKGELGPVGETGETGERGDRGLKGKQGLRGLKGAKGDAGKDGKDGAPGKDGKDGASAFEIWLESNPGKTKRDYLQSMKPSMGVRSVGIGSGGGGLAAVQKLREELEGTDAPKSATLTRDGNGAVETVTVEGEATWSLSRNPNESVASLTNGTYDVAVDRDGNGVVTGITVT